jgi:hypothetical protein
LFLAKKLAAVTHDSPRIQDGTKQNHHVQKKHIKNWSIKMTSAKSPTKVKTNQNRPTNILLQHRPSPEKQRCSASQPVATVQAELTEQASSCMAPQPQANQVNF